MQSKPSGSALQRWRHWIVAMALLAPAPALAQGADELASTIEQTMAGIEFRIDIRPEQAARDLEEQQRRLDLLAEQAPDHPALPELRQKFEQLQARLADSLEGAAEEAAEGSGSAQVPTAPEDFTSGMEEVAELQRQAETELLRGRTEEAAGYLQQSEAEMAELERRYAEDIPPGHVPLIVAKERLATLKDQLEDRAQGGAGASIGRDAAAGAPAPPSQ